MVYLGKLFLISEVAQFFGLFFPRIQSCALILTKDGLGYILGDFITNSPGADVMIRIFCDLCQFSAEKLAFFSKSNVMLKNLHNLALFRVKNANNLALF
jgi:hypothetical protein